MLKIVLFTVLSFVQAEDQLLYNPQKVDANGVVEFKYADYTTETGFQKTVKFSSYLPLKENVNTSSESFNAISSDNFASLKTTIPLTQAEYDCGETHQSRFQLLYGLYGYAAKFYENADIAPSITGLIKAGPNLFHYTGVPTEKQGTQGFIDVDISQQCNKEITQVGGFSQLFYGLDSFGVVDSGCIPNNDIPSGLTQCADGSAIKSYLKGYTIGDFSNGNVDTVKNALLKFGPVWHNDDGLYVGWEKIDGVDNWITIQEREDDEEQEYYKSLYYQLNVPIGTKSTYAGRVVFFSDPYYGCTKITAETPEETCPCPSDKTELNDDPRHTKGGICAAGTTRITLKVIATVLLLPVFTLFI
ncbi:MAG: hypothetical protein EZS28_009984 [Streblomastix strix]|uniref:Uncharacterized protein n=1 Tax=Streblomastix strix TaxID=222440 RepID=A0A5J4WHK9_9EUKA|nr:MAG: hypothetical protein EZS28_009984 [Streblomastix strix]